MSRLRIAVVGAGGIAQEHLRVLSVHPECQVTLLCDSDLNRRSTTAAQFRIPEHVDNIAAVIQRDDIDAVFVLVSVTAVAAVASQFVNAGIPTFLEKPPGLYSTDTAHLAELASRYGCIAMVGLNRRFYSNHLDLKQLLKAHDPLATITVEAHEDLGVLPTRWRTSKRGELPGIVLRRWAIANGIHALDLLRYFGGEVTEVQAVVRARFELGFPDSVTAILKFANGAQGRALVDWMAPGNHRFDIRCIGVCATSDPGFHSTVFVQRDRGEVRLEPDAEDRNFKPGFWKQDSAFLNYVRQGCQPCFPSPTLEDAHRTMVLIEQICDLPTRPVVAP